MFNSADDRLRSHCGPRKYRNVKVGEEEEDSYGRKPARSEEHALISDVTYVISALSSTLVKGAAGQTH